MIDPRCIKCRVPKSGHVANENGMLVCPPVVNYFTPCPHPTKTGWGSISSDGTSDGEMWCDACGEQVLFKRSVETQPDQS